MMTSLEHAAEIVRIINDHSRILAVAHASPDGDAMGCTAGMGWILQSLGKQFLLVNRNGVPEHLRWMRMPQPVEGRDAIAAFRPQLVIIMDCGDYWRIGNDLGSEIQTIPSINMDHHAGNNGFGSLHNWVDPSMAAAGMMLEYVADAAGVPLTGGLAEAMYVSLVSDTGSFTHGNTSAETFRLAERLLRGGLHAAELRDQMDNQWTMAKTAIWGALLGRVRLESGGQIAVCSVSKQDLHRFGASKEDLEGFAEQMRRIRGVRVAILLRETPEGGTKCSLRSCGDDDVGSLAARFGGGGHKNAAGATLGQSLEQAEKTILKALSLS